MGKRGTIGCKSHFKTRVNPKRKDSDDSDEDYVVSDEAVEASDGDLEDWRSSLDRHLSDDSFSGLVEEEDEMDVEDRRPRKIRKPRSKTRAFNNNSIRGIKRNRASYQDDEEYKGYERGFCQEKKREKNRRPESKTNFFGRTGALRSTKRNGISFDYYEEEIDEEGNDEDYRDDDGEEEEEEWEPEEEEEREQVDADFKGINEVYTGKRRTGRRGRSKAGRSSLSNRGNAALDLGNYKRKEDPDFEAEEYDEDDDDDEEFTPDADVSLDEEELPVDKKKKKSGVKRNRTVPRKRKSGVGRKRRKKASASKRSSRNKREKGRSGGFSKRKKTSIEDDDDFIDDISHVRKKAQKKTVAKKRKYTVPSDSDFVPSGASDYEYTISEEEREQVIEANKLCGDFRTSLRSFPFSSKNAQNGEGLLCSSKPPVRKGKEKVEEANPEVANRICGICLSDEDRRKLRGTLDCCSHYFCFTCIMEWSKVESRCPLCKQRFKTVSKPARSAAGIDLRDVVVQVPERDQIYQPTEEELRSYLDPYENVTCIECHQDGDDDLMLLCDLCDSSAHTYCVGLGNEVPVGNWYCDGCKPIALGSTGIQNSSPLPAATTPNHQHRASPGANSLNLVDATLLASSPRATFFHGFGNLLSLRLNNNDVPIASPSSAGAPTLSRRRSLHRHIHNLLSMNRVGGIAVRNETPNSSNGSLDPQTEQNCELAFQPNRTHLMGAALNADLGANVHPNPSSSAFLGELFIPSRLHHVRSGGVHNPTNIVHGARNLTLWPDLAGNSPALNNEQHTQQNGDGGSVLAMGIEVDFSMAKEQLQMTVKTHLKNLSAHIDLGQSTFDDVVRCSVHTIFAACGLEHQNKEVDVVPPPVTCSHVRNAGSGGDQSNLSLIKGCCLPCFDIFVKDVVKMIMDTRLPQWLSLGL